MIEKRFKMKKLEYEDYFIDSQQEYVDEDEPNFEIDGEKTMSDSQILDLLNENEQLKQSYKEFEDECQSTFNAMSRKQNDLYRKNFKLKEENEELKQELKIYRKIATCSNCKYQNYDWFDDGDEFEICEKGNNDQQIEYHICKDWEEFE